MPHMDMPGRIRLSLFLPLMLLLESLSLPMSLIALDSTRRAFRVANHLALAAEREASQWRPEVGIFGENCKPGEISLSMLSLKQCSCLPPHPPTCK